MDDDVPVSWVNDEVLVSWVDDDVPMSCVDDDVPLSWVDDDVPVSWVNDVPMSRLHRAPHIDFESICHALLSLKSSSGLSHGGLTPV
ncbi:hypothetical protein P7K49_004420 [Saguinus oedipus]|uniref:Uncharacterized protein n=1 Tax=Saguinus oedipus TaxID=9490 RepID=A0ABQ9W8X5_SAGOE|nr:hypothetical protein P7K49_004420 [Saguinus oedipus]